MAKELFLGLDLSTQSLTAVVIDLSNKEIRQNSLNFDDRYPSYKTEGGVIICEDPKVVHSDPRMWIEALDDILNWLKEKGLTAHIRGIGVSAQQHGSVYLNQDAPVALSLLNPSHKMLAQIQNIFSRKTSPVWMDSSTNKECLEITESLGDDLNVARLTGSIATERFAGPQIRKFWKEGRENYEKTNYIALISSFVTSLLIGRLVPVDAGDGFGMNLADIRTGEWSEAALRATAPDLKRRLPQLMIKDDVVGNVSKYLVERYSFNPDTKVIVGSGDNPCSLVGLGLIGEPNISAISLGTSDTYFGYMPKLLDKERSTGHIFGTANGKYMFLICFKNGSLAREQVKNSYSLSWHEFSKILLDTPPGNRGRIMLPYFLPEITPLMLAPEVSRFGGLAKEDAQANVRAVAEAQVMAMYLHSDWTGHQPKSILVTAGGSENRGLLKVISHVFGAEVRSFEVKESAALGAAIRAVYCCLNNEGAKIGWNELIETFVKGHVAHVVYPSPNDVKIYHDKHGLLSVYEACEKFALGIGENPHKKIEVFKKQFPNHDGPK